MRLFPHFLVLFLTSLLLLGCGTAAKIQPEPLSDVFIIKRVAGGSGPWKWERDDLYEVHSNGKEKYIGTTVASGFAPYAISTLGAGDIPNREVAISADGRSIVFVHWPLHAPRNASLGSNAYRYRYGDEPHVLLIKPRSRVRWPKPLPGNLMPFDRPGVTWAMRADDYAEFPLALLDAQPIHKHAFDGQTRECESLIANGVDINAQTYWGFTPLDLAITLGHEGTAIRLLELGADPDKGMYPALNLAVMLGRIDVVGALLKRGAAVNLQDEFGYTPLHQAVYAGSRLVGGIGLFFPNIVTPRSMIDRDITTNLVRVLLENGADPSLQNRRGRTALDEATQNTPPETIQLLLEYSARAGT